MPKLALRAQIVYKDRVRARHWVPTRACPRPVQLNAHPAAPQIKLSLVQGHCEIDASDLYIWGREGGGSKGKEGEKVGGEGRGGKKMYLRGDGRAVWLV